jgi:hypothetical protein
MRLVIKGSAFGHAYGQDLSLSQSHAGVLSSTHIYFPNQVRNKSDFLFDPRLIVEDRGTEFFFRFVDRLKHQTPVAPYLHGVDENA